MPEYAGVPARAILTAIRVHDYSKGVVQPYHCSRCTSLVVHPGGQRRRKGWASVVAAAISLVVASFLASSVEMVEALTIVLAVGVTRGWRSANIGVVVALVALAIVIAILGPAINQIPIDALRVLVGGILLVFGLQWLRKAILRAGGYKALHDEAAIFQKQLAAAQAAGTQVRAGMDWYAFTLCFKGVFLEGMEVAFIVITFGTTAAHGTNTVGLPGIQLAAAGAAAAVILVGIAGVVVRQPLSRVPENWLKYAVGILLTTFGTFWSTQGAIGIATTPNGANVEWPLQDAALMVLLVIYLLVSFGLVAMLRRRNRSVTMRPAVAAH